VASVAQQLPAGAMAETKMDVEGHTTEGQPYRISNTARCSDLANVSLFDVSEPNDVLIVPASAMMMKYRKK